MTAARAAARAVAAAPLAALLSLLAAPPVRAHFLLDVSVRTIVVEAEPGGYRVFIRLPMPMVVAGRSVPAPYTVDRDVAGQRLHYVDGAKVLADPAGLGRLVADGHRLAVGGKALEGRVERVRVHRREGAPRFNAPDAARAAVKGPAYPLIAPPLPAGDAVVDVELVYPYSGRAETFELSSTLAPGLPGEDRTENLLLFRRSDGGVDSYRAQGLLATPIAVGASPLAAAATFGREGVRHILEGQDHVLFVLCLALGAVSLRALVTRATGFTAGHTVTLIAGFLGYVPKVPWFVPAVETGIALSIIYVAAGVLSARVKSRSLLVTTLMGLLHGFGFSFVLGEVLGLDSANLTVSLVAFNVGVEVGQLAIILLVWPALRLADGRAPRMSGYARAAVACASIAVAALWVGTRSVALLQAMHASA